MSDYFNCKWGSYARVEKNCSIYNTVLGDLSYISRNTVTNNAHIGKFCSIGPDCLIGPGKHPSNQFVSTHPIFYSKKINSKIKFTSVDYFCEHEQIVIGNDVWIGAKVVIMDGMQIGDGSIIASGAVVTKNVEPYAIVGGIPAKVIKYRFTPSEIEELLESKWWEKDIFYLKQRFKDFHSIERFFQHNLNDKNTN